MDSFTLHTLDQFIKRHKREIVLKLASLKLTDKNITNQADLINMVLDYTPVIKAPPLFIDKINLAKLKYTPNLKKRVNQSCMLTLSKISEIENENENDKSYSYEDDEEDSEKEESHKKAMSKSPEKKVVRKNKTVTKKNENENDISQKQNEIYLYIKNNIIKKIIENILTQKTNIALSSVNKNKKVKLRLTQKKLIRIYIFSTNNFIEMEFSQEETIFVLKKKILNKLENSVNMQMKYHQQDAYELRPTQGLDIIYFKNKDEITEKNKNIENKTQNQNDFSPDMEKPPIAEQKKIIDIDKDALCFIEKPGFISRKPQVNHAESLIEDNSRKLYGEVISNTEEQKANIKVYIKIDKNSSSNTTIVQLNSNQCLKDVFEKVIVKIRFEHRNMDFYYFVDHCDGRENENMDDALNNDLEIKYLPSYELDLYNKKFFDMPVKKNLANNNYQLNFTEEKKIEVVSEQKHEFTFNENTAGVYQEFPVIKISTHGKKQERILGIDLYNLYNVKGKNNVTIFNFRNSSSKPIRRISEIKEITATGEKSFYIVLDEGNGQIKKTFYEVSHPNIKNEIIAKITYLLKMNRGFGKK